ncbi:sushi domain-containing protein 6-like [Coregonus clupeaformis]|uniref:Sushi domain-containing protein n=1 Tax=Coregonus suidteri TaxID=861788 RepID=A0AAN8L311_9TELE|nr:sushi domain-containing protein 6-like [Coregonus clupeaformis]XP_045066059.1 sushi domain-containing protein 6-like [Coregonus clupeaformis]
MSDGMVLCETRALATSSSSSSSSPVRRLATSALLLLSLLPHGHASGCPQPVGVQHGEMVNQTEANRGSSPPGTLLSYSCEPGYAPNGPTTITCTTAGTWSHQPPHCIRTDVCPPPTEPENGGYRCHPSPCHRLTQKTVIEYFCDEGYALKGDYKFLTCQNGEWDAAMQITCRLSQDKELRSPLAMPALSIVASTASSVALLLLLVVLFVLLQPKLKSFHHSRREQGVSGQPASIVVEGVQVALPSYEEAVYGSGGASLPPPPESRVQIVLSEGPQGAEGGAEVLGPSNRFQSHHHRDRDTELCLPSTSTSSSSFPSSSRHSETVLVHQAPSRSSSSSSSWVTEHGGGACGGAAPVVTLARRRDSESSDQHSLQSVTSVDDFSDDIPLLKEA